MIGKIAASLLSATALANPASLLPPGYTTYDAPASGGYVAPAPAAPAAPAMDPMMMMLLMKDDSSSMSDLLPLLMMSGGAGGAGGLGGMDPMMMMLMMDGDSDMSDLLPLMMMGGMGGAAGGAGGMNPMLMMTLLGDSCSPSSDIYDDLESGEVTVDDDFKKDLATGAKFLIGTTTTVDDANVKTSDHEFSETEVGEAQRFIDFDYQKCSAGGSGMSDLLPLMMMGGGAGGAGGMDPMMMMLMMGDDSSMSDLLPLMMMGGMGGGAAGGAAAGGMDPMMMMMLMGDDSSMSDLLPLMMMGGMGGAGAEGGMNPLLMMTLLGDSDDDDKTEEDCDKKFKLDSTVSVAASGSGYAFSEVTDIEDIRAVFTTAVAGYPDVSDTDGFAAKYASCLADPTAYDFGSSGMSDLLPLMMMSGGKIDPMMLMLMGDDDSSMSDLLPLMMMSGGLGGAEGGAAMDPMMMMLLLKD